jgi:hypothetical protein
MQKYLDSYQQQTMLVTLPSSEEQNGTQQQQQQQLAPHARWIQWQCHVERTIGDDPEGSPPGRPHCGGLADRIKGILMATILALIDGNRVVLVEDWAIGPSSNGDGFKFSDYLQPRLVAWNMTPPSEGNSTSDDDVVNWDTWYSGSGKKTAQMKTISKAPCTFHEDHAGIRFTGNKVLSNLKSKLEENCPAWKGRPTDSTVLSTFFHVLFQFTPRVRAAAATLRGPSLEVAARRNWYVAAHVRTGNFTGAVDHGTDLLRQHTTVEWDQFAECIEIIADAMGAHCPGHATPSTYLASDNAGAKRYIVDRVAAQTSNSSNDYVVRAPDVEIVHMDHQQAVEAAVGTGGDQAGTLSAYDAVMAEFKILTDATCLITSDSGFSNLAQALSRHQPKRCYIGYEQCTVKGLVEKRVSRVTCPPRG